MTVRGISIAFRRFLWVGLTGGALGGCVEQDPLVAPVLEAAKGGGGIIVTSADPGYAHEGEVSKRVTIKGSGFASGDQASWERNGVADPKITVVSTAFVNSSTLDATINIANDAEVAFYDIAIIRGGRKGGIGTELFEVTQATPIDGTSILRGVNEQGMLGVGLEFPAYWTSSTGLVLLPQMPPDGGGVWAIDEAGITMTGFEYPQIGVIPVWTQVSGVWHENPLPDDPTAVGGLARAIASDPISGAAVYIGGQEFIPVGKHGSAGKPRLWYRDLTEWQRIVLPSLALDGGGVVEDLTPTGIAVGSSNGRAAIWEPDGRGGWSIAYFPGAATNATGINSAGDLVVGSGGNYWRRQTGGGWIGNLLPIPCGARADVDDLGRIAAGGCQKTGQVTAPAVFLPPYSGPPIWLGGLGNHANVTIEKMSIRGSWV
ncbi:MAG TPA: hypothetical protein VJU15_15280, partial [Gemmatimonadales bacterium]|nr:hypothetical protein [Gemmatimonadales bacterium]